MQRWLIVIGLLLVAASFDGFGPILRLWLAGDATWGETRQVAMTADGAEAIFISDAQVRDEVDRRRKDRDRTAFFWPEFRFQMADGRQVIARSPIGYRIPYGRQADSFVPMRDRDGLPTREWIWYDPARPERILLPMHFSTWFIPVLLALFGVVGSIMGFLLARRARTPIEIPDLSATADAGKPAVH